MIRKMEFPGAIPLLARAITAKEPDLQNLAIPLEELEVRNLRGIKA